MSAGGLGPRRGTYRKPTPEEAANFAAINERWLLWSAQRQRAERRRAVARKVTRGVLIAIVYTALAGLVLAALWLMFALFAFAGSAFEPMQLPTI